MNIEKISLVNFKNHESINLDFDNKLNFIFGENGVGKTNILDSIYYLSFTKSFLKNIDKSNVKYGELFFSIKGTFLINNFRNEVFLGFDSKKNKIIKVNDKICEKFSKHIGKFPIVITSPYDSSLILNFSETRRRFIDLLISQFDNIYLNNLVIYKKLLKQRNSLLKNKIVHKDDLSIYDEKLSKTANYIFLKRQEIIQSLNKKASNYYKAISNCNDEIVDILYKSQLYDSDLISLFKKNINKDQILNHTSSGIHRDDIEFNLKNNAFKKNASQGQQKSLILSLKFAEFDILKEKLNLNPLILIDDLFDKLDENRIKNILVLLNKNFNQVILTDTNDNRTKKFLNDLKLNANSIYIKKK